MLSVQAHSPPAPAEIRLTQHYDVLKELGESYAALGRLDEAEQCYLQAATLAPARAEPYVGIGIVAVQRGRLDQAEAAFEIAAERQADCAEAYGGLAMVRQQQADYAGALDMYLRCLELDADNLVALLGLFQTSCQMGTFAQVIHYLELYLNRHPGDASVLFCLATLYAREGQLERAEDCLLSVLALEPGKAEAARLLEQVRGERAAAAPDAISA